MIKLFNGADGLYYSDNKLNQTRRVFKSDEKRPVKKKLFSRDAFISVLYYVTSVLTGFCYTDR